jgi:hypothetical protein
MDPDPLIAAAIDAHTFDAVAAPFQFSQHFVRYTRFGAHNATARISR